MNFWQSITFFFNVSIQIIFFKNFYPMNMNILNIQKKVLYIILLFPNLFHIQITQWDKNQANKDLQLNYYVRANTGQGNRNLKK